MIYLLSGFRGLLVQQVLGVFSITQRLLSSFSGRSEAQRALVAFLKCSFCFGTQQIPHCTRDLQVQLALRIQFLEHSGGHLSPNSNGVAQMFGYPSQLCRALDLRKSPNFINFWDLPSLTLLYPINMYFCLLDSKSRSDNITQHVQQPLDTIDRRCLYFIYYSRSWKLSYELLERSHQHGVVIAFWHNCILSWYHLLLYL
jgi:hypothetical protein